MRLRAHGHAGPSADLSGADTVTVETTETGADVDRLFVASVYDGRRHTVVADLEGHIPDYNGYYTEYCRMDFLNGSLAGDTADISFVGFFTSVEAAERYAETLDTED